MPWGDPSDSEGVGESEPSVVWSLVLIEAVTRLQTHAIKLSQPILIRNLIEQLKSVILIKASVN